jgi:predicted GNAT family acetyltransferase
MTSDSDGMVTLTGSAQDDTERELAAPVEQTDDLVITDNSETGVYEAALGGRTVAGAVYHRAGDRVTLLATSVFPEFRGRGIAARLLGGVFDRLRAEGATVTVTCPFTTAFLKAHPEYADLVR